jgi:hypothetical protein
MAAIIAPVLGLRNGPYGIAWLWNARHQETAKKQGFSAILPIFPAALKSMAGSKLRREKREKCPL